MKKRILCFGDSNTWGYNACAQGRYPEDVRWTGLLQAKLGSDYTVIEEGQNGRTTVWDDPVENRLAGLTYLWPCMESQHPFDLIVIMLGTNDTKIYFGVGPQSIAQSAGRLADLAQKSPFGIDGNPPQVLLVAPIEIRNNPVFDEKFGSQAEEKSRGFAKAFEEIAEQYHCHFLNAAEFAQPGTADGLHLDEENHAKLADAMEKKIRSILK